MKIINSKNINNNYDDENKVIIKKDTIVASKTLSNQSLIDKNMLFIHNLEPVMGEKIYLIKPIVLKLLQKLDMNEDNILQQSIPEHVKYIMELIENVDVNGEKKKEVVLNVLKNIGKHYLSNEQNTILITIIENNIVSKMIDMIILASKGDINVNKIIEPVTNTTNCLFNCFSLLTRK